MASDSGDSVVSGQPIAVGHHASGIAVVTMRGEHDLSTHALLAQALELAAAHSNVVVDLTACSFIDSTVIQEFLKTADTLRPKGEQVVLVIPREQAAVTRIAELAALAQLFELRETTEDAYALLARTTRGDEASS
jgi:anti-anti-sigma factor